jgi:hypothetical protein
MCIQVEKGPESMELLLLLGRQEGGRELGREKLLQPRIIIYFSKTQHTATTIL